MAVLGGEITFLNGGSIVAQEFNEISSSSVPNLAIEGYVLKGREVTYTGGGASVLMKDGTSITSGDDSLKVGMIINNSLVDKYISQDGAFMLSAHFEQLNPTISQLHIDGVTYDLRDRNAGEGVTPEEKAKLAALPEAAEIPSDIGPKSEVVEEVPSEYVAGKVYFVVDVGPKYKDKTELIALGSADAILSELNRDAEGYYNFINAVTPEGLMLVEARRSYEIYDGLDHRFFPYQSGNYNVFQYIIADGGWHLVEDHEPV